MNVDDKVKRIIENTDFAKLTKKAESETEQSRSHRNMSEKTQSKKRIVLKKKNSLLHSSVSPDVRKLFYQDGSALNKKKTDSVSEDSKGVTLPSLTSTEYQQQMKSLYQVISEIFPMDHPMWTELLKENQSPEELVNENSEYFISLLNILYCEGQVKQIQDDKSNLGKKYSTQYSKDFQPKYTQELNAINQNIYTEFKPENTFVLSRSSYNQYYTPVKYTKVDSCKPDFIPDKNAQTFLSMYKGTFMNWQPKYHGKIGPVSTHLNSSLPFIAKTSYSDNFISPKAGKAKLANFDKLGPFVKNPQLLVTETTNQQQFQHQLTSPTSMFKPVPSPNMYTQSYSGQYKTQFQQSFNTSPQTNGQSFTDKYFTSSMLQQLLDRKQKTRL